MRPIHYLDCVAHLRHFLSDVGSLIYVDLEGTLGRFARAPALVQLCKEDRAVVLVDSRKAPATLEVLSELWANQRVRKVFHDVKEDAAVLRNSPQYEGLVNVCDTQMAHVMLLERKGLPKYLCPLPEMLCIYAPQYYRKHRWDAFDALKIDAPLWEERPLPRALMRYAVEGVVALPRVYTALLERLGDPSGDALARRSRRFVEYAELNLTAIHHPDCRAIHEGTELDGFVSKTTDEKVHFQLNAGSLSAVAERKGPLSHVQVCDVTPLHVTESSERCLHVASEGVFDYRHQRMRTTLDARTALSPQPSRRPQRGPA